MTAAKHVIISTGRSGGGKSTVTRILAEYMADTGVTPAIISMDSYAAERGYGSTAQVATISPADQRIDILAQTLDLIDSTDHPCFIIDSSSEFRTITDDELDLLDKSLREIDAHVTGIYAGALGPDGIGPTKGLLQVARTAIYLMNHRTTNESPHHWINDEQRKDWIQAGGQEADLEYCPVLHRLITSPDPFRVTIERLPAGSRNRAQRWLLSAFSFAAQAAVLLCREART